MSLTNLTMKSKKISTALMQLAIMVTSFSASAAYFPTRATFEGLRNDMSPGTETLSVDNILNGINTYTTADLFPAIFQYVDEIRVTNPAPLIAVIGTDASQGTGGDTRFSTATGTAAKGSNWELEKSVGEVQANGAFTTGTMTRYTVLPSNIAGSLDFNGPDDSDLGTIVTDGMAGSTDIANIDYQIFATDANGSANGTVWGYYSDLGLGVGGIVGDLGMGDPSLRGDPMVIIKSADGAEFSFDGITTLNIDGMQAEVTFAGYRDGVLIDLVTLDVDYMVTGINEFTTADLPPSIFQYVDEVRITNPDIPSGAAEEVVTLGFDHIVFGDPVTPNLSPIIDANGASTGTTNVTTFTENGPAVHVVTNDATLSDDGNIEGMTLVLDATPDGGSESIAYNAALNGGASLATLDLTGNYDSGTRTYTVSGTATAAMYQGVLRAMEYNNASDNPNTTARTVTISATDAEGATGQATTTINITAVNDAPSAPDLTASSDRGSSNTDNLTNDTTPTFTGTAEAGATVRLYADDAEVGFTTADGSGNWSITSAPLDEGTYDITARAGDTGNLSAPSSSLSVTIDVTGPAVSVPGMADASDSGSSNTDNITNVRRPELTGTAPAGTFIQLFIDYAGNGDATNPLNEFIGTGTADAGGTWTITPTSDLVETTLSIKARGQDDAGNFGAASSSLDVTIDVTPPAAVPAVPDLATGSDTGSSSTDNLTNDTTPTFTGTAEVGTTVRLYANGVEVGFAPADGSGNWSITSDPLDEGTYDITARAEDGAGNLSAPSPPLSVTIDVTGPAALSTPDLADASDSGSSNTDNITNVRQPEFTGTAPAGTFVQLFIDNAGNGDPYDPLNESIGTGTAGAGGTWSITPTEELSPGTWSIKARGRDNAGNFGAASSSVNVTIDITPPAAVPAVPDLATGSDTGSSDSDNITNDTTPTFSGTHTANNVVRLYADGELVGSATANGSGIWTITSDALGAGTYSFTARGVDLAGNEGTASSGLSVTIDPDKPAAPSTPDMEAASDTGNSDSDNNTEDTTPTFSGTGAEANATVYLYVGGVEVGESTADGSGNWSVTVSAGMALDAGDYFVVVRTIDAAGNLSDASGALPIHINTAPTANGNLSQTVSYTEDPGGSVALDDIVVSDVDPGEAITATLTLSDAAAGSLSTGTFGSATSTFNSTTGVWTVTGSVADVNAALAAVAFTPSADYDQNFTITTHIEDAAGAGPEDGTITVTVTPVNDAPILDGGGSPALTALAEDAGSPVNGSTAGSTLVSALTGGISDVDAGASRGIAVIATSAQGTLWYSLDGGTTWNTAPAVSAAGALLLPSEARVYFRPLADISGTISDAFTFRAWDRTSGTGGATANTTANGGTTPFSVATGTASLAVSPVADKPTATNLDQTISFTEGEASVAIDDIVVTDPDEGETITATLTISAPTAGSLTTGTYGSATSTFNPATGIWAVTGSVADVNAALAAVAFTPAADWDQNFTITTRVWDAEETGPEDGTITVTVTPVNDAPVITSPATIDVDEDVPSALTGISFSDVDAGSGSVTATLAVPGGSLAAASGGSVTVGGTGSALTLTGTIADVNAFIASGSVAYTTAQNETDDVTLTVTINDGGNTGTGGAREDAATATLQVAAVNDAPVNTVPGGQAVDQNGVLVFSAANSNAISVADADAGGGIIQVTLTAANGLLTLSGTAGLTFSAGDGTDDGTMAFEGTVADINPALAGLEFAPTGGYNGPASLQIISDDNGLSGAGGTQTDTDEISITVNSISPTVNTTGSLSPDGTYKIGDGVILTVTFDQTVTVDESGGSPALLLETGDTDREAVYDSGSGSNTLAFTYTVEAGDHSADLDYASTAALVLNGATIRNTAADDAVLTLPAVDGSNSIAGQHGIVIDGVAPAAPSRPLLYADDDTGTSGSDHITNVAAPRFTGTAEAGSTVRLYDTDGVTELGQAVATDGNWTITSDVLTEDTHTLTAIATDAAGNPGEASEERIVVIDITAPAKPAVPDLAPASDSGESDTDNITNLADLTLRGAAGSVEANTALHARSSLDGGLTGGTANADGSWSFDVSALVEGTHQLQINATDAAGNTSVYSDAVTVVIDATAPDGHSVSFDDDAINATEAASIGFSFSDAEAGAGYSYTITGSGGGTPVTGAGTLTAATDPVSGIDVSGLSDGTLTLSVMVMDAAGNGAGAVTDAAILDRVVPEVTGVESGEYYRDDVTPAFDEGTALLNGNPYVSGTPITAEGGYKLVVTDAAGNMTVVAFTIDKTVPEVTGVVSGEYYKDDVTPAFDEGTALLNGNPYVSGTPITAEGGYKLVVTDASGNADTVRFTIDKTLPEITGVDDGASYNRDVTPSFNEGTATLNGEPFTSGTVVTDEGEYTLVVTDTAGNADTVRFTIDKTLPEITGVDDGASYNRDVTPSFNEGTATLNGEPFTSGTVVTDEGEYTLVVTDTAGNADTVSFIVDKTIPEITGVTDGASYNENVTVTFNEGTATLNGEPYTPGTVITEEDEYTLVVTDAAGNATTVSFAIDKTAPVVTGVEEGGLYAGEAAASFNEGTATLNGGPYTAGTPIAVPGEYTLTVTDAAGNETAVRFTVGVLPGAPSGLRAEAGNRQVMLEWEAPAGVIPAVTDYVIGYSRDGGTTWTVPDREPSSATRSLVIGLENNRSYLFRVAAVNGVGTGAASGTVQAIPTEPVPDVEGNLPEPDPGVPVVVTDGKVEAVMLEVVDSEYLRLSGDGYAMELASIGPNGERIPISAIDAVIRLLKGNGTQVYVSGNGFEPGTMVTVYLFSTPELAGHLPVGPDGTYGGMLPVPANLELGRHTLQANGVVAGGGGERSVSVGLELVDRKPQWVELGALADRMYGDGPVTLDGKSTSGLAVSYAVTDGEGKPTDIAAIENNNRLNIRGAGDILITASQVGNADYSAALPVTRTLHIGKAPLGVSVASTTRAYGEPNPAFKVSYDGFVPGEDASSFDRAPSAATDAGETSAPGGYAITVSGGASANYAFIYSDATLTVTRAQQAITFTSPGEVDRSAGSMQLDVSSGSGLPVTLSIDDPQVATVSGTTLNILRLGTVTITATQAGDGNYEAAEPVTVTIIVTDRSSDFAVRVHPAVSPNGDGINEFLMVEGIKDFPENRVTVISRNGTLLWEASGYDNDRVVFRGISTAQQQLPAGTYFYIVEVKVDGKWEYEKGYFVIRY